MPRKPRKTPHPRFHNEGSDLGVFEGIGKLHGLGFWEVWVRGFGAVDKL